MPEAAAAAVTVPLLIGRYALFDELAAGGMATVHLGRLLGAAGFGRTVAVKRLHAHLLRDDEFIAMFMDEARIAARIRHPNVVPVADVVRCDEGLFLIMDYVHGESLSRLMRTARQREEVIPTTVACAIMHGALLGLHAAHDTKGSDGQLLGVVHRDVSPQNIIVGADGSARVLDFGIAKAAGRAQVTREGQIKGKLTYMAPEQIRGHVDRRTDVFAAAVILWEMLANRRLHHGASEIDIVTRVVEGRFVPPSQFQHGLDPRLDAIVMRGLATDGSARFQSARELALALERVVGLASPSEVSAWVSRLAAGILCERSAMVAAMELAIDNLVTDRAAPSSSALPPGAFPVRSGGSDSSPAIGDVPSSSAVFSQPRYSGRPSWGALQHKDAAAWLVITFSGALVVAGIILALCGFARRTSRARARDAPTSSTMTSPKILPRSTPPATAVDAPVSGVAGRRPPSKREERPSTWATAGATSGAAAGGSVVPSATLRRAGESVVPGVVPPVGDDVDPGVVPAAPRP